MCVWFFMFVVVFCDYYCFLFFFFKQKTAYEMRISDWSSDVCSSDLTDGIVRHHVDDAQAHEGGEADRRPAVVGEHQEGAAVGDEAAVQGDEIGRASCRERVCQYV